MLSRANNLPTVWSNCLAGWWLGGGRKVEALPWLFAGATFLYLGGAFLNDALDAPFDRQHRRGRPVPSGAVSLTAVWRWGVVWLALGLFSLGWLGGVAGGLGLALVFCILFYNLVHRLVTFSPVILGVCRFFLYVIGSAAGGDGVSGWAIWCGLGLAAYVSGLWGLARWEKPADPLRYWPVVLLGIPILLALLMDMNAAREPGLLLSAVLVLWCLRSLRRTLWSTPPVPGSTMSGLMAGIVLVDWLAVADGPRELSAAFIGLFLAAVVFQRFGTAH